MSGFDRFSAPAKRGFHCVPGCVPGRCVPLQKVMAPVVTELETSPLVTSPKRRFPWKHLGNTRRKSAVLLLQRLLHGLRRGRSACALPPFMESKNSVRAWGSCGRSFGGAAPAPPTNHPPNTPKHTMKNGWCVGVLPFLSYENLLKHTKHT